MDFIIMLENAIGKKAKKKFLPIQTGDVKETYADINDLTNYIGFKPKTKLEDGIQSFVKWYRQYFNC